jgi:hypothetical protein
MDEERIDQMLDALEQDRAAEELLLS